MQKTGDVTTIKVTYIAPASASGTNYATLSYIVSDSYGAITQVSTISIDIAPNTLPVALPIAPITVQEKETSTEFTIEGTDEDIADQDSLKAVIIAVPTKATLLADGEEVQLEEKYDLVSHTILILF